MNKKQKPFCQGTTIKGRPCISTIVLSDGYCLSHSPAQRAAFLQKNTAAGKKPKQAISTLAKDVRDSGDLYEFIGSLLSDIRKGKVRMSGKQSIATVAVLGKLFMDAEKRSVLIKKIEKLEQ